MTGRRMTYEKGKMTLTKLRWSEAEGKLTSSDAGGLMRGGKSLVRVVGR